MKKYKIRIYIFSNIIGLIVNKMIEKYDLLTLENSFVGSGECLCIYDVECEKNALDKIISLGIPYLPLNNYEDFEITCPKCGKRINDDSFIKVYDETLLGGLNIKCTNGDCGEQLAKVKYIGKYHL